MNYKFRPGLIGYNVFFYRVLGGRLFVYLILGVFVSLMDGIGISMFIPLLQSTVNENGKVGQQSQFDGILQHFERFGLEPSITVILSILVIVFCLKGFAKFLQGKYQVILRYYFFKKIRSNLIMNLRNLSYEGFMQLNVGRIQNNLVLEVQRLFQNMNHYFNAAKSVMMFLTYLLLALLANYQFALFVILGTSISNLLFRRFQHKTIKVSNEVSKTGNFFNSYLIQAIHYFKYLKATGQFNKYSEQMSGAMDKSEELNKEMGNYTAIVMGIREPTVIIIVAIVIYVQVVLMGFQFSAIMLALLMLFRALTSLMAFMNVWQYFMQNVGAMTSIHELSSEMQTLAEKQQGAEPVNSILEVTLEGVGYERQGKQILNNVNLVIKPNHTTGIIGESGSGKTTVANIIAGLISPSDGKVLINGIPSFKLNLMEYRSKIGYISQDPAIFDDTIFNNVTFFDDPTPANLKRFFEVIEDASLSEFLEKIDGHEQAVLGMNGTLISGGQKQRIAIARELYKRADLLIFDEATSALDAETEAAIRESLKKLHGSCTILVISHRLSNIRDADLVYIMDDGTIIESGSPEELITYSALFRRLVAVQQFHN